MNSTRVESLSERQAECLRLLGRGLSAKNIAAELDLSHETVNAHLKAARRALGVNRSTDAARLLALAEADPGSQSMGTHELALSAHLRATADPAQRKTGPDGSAPWNEVRDARTPFRDAAADHPGLRAWRGRYDDLAPAPRLVMIAAAMVACVIVVAGLVAIAGGLQAMLWSLLYHR